MNFVQSINQALRDALADPSVVIVRQGVRNQGMLALTDGLDESRQIIYPVSEALMNSSAMGLALAGYRVIVLHVRMDFLAPGMDALINHIPVWSKKGIKLPIVFLCQIGRGMGQGPQHSKDLTPMFNAFDGWEVVVPTSAPTAYSMLMDAITGDKPVIYAAHRHLFNTTGTSIIRNWNVIRLCGSSKRHETVFYSGT